MTGFGKGGDPGFVESARRILVRRFAWGGTVAATVLAFVVLVLLLSRPVYRADARLRLGEPPPSPGVSPTGGLLSFLRTGGDPFSNDLEVLSSRTIAEDVVRAAALSVELDAPRGWFRDSLFLDLSLQDTTIKATFEARWTGAEVSVERTSPVREAVGRFRTGEAAVFGGLRVTFAPRRPGSPDRVRLKTVPFGEAVRTTSGRIAVERTRREANVLEISYTHTDPGVARFVVEAAVERFVALRTRLFRRESDETVDSLRAVARGTEEELRAAEDTLETIQRRTGIVAPEAQSEALVDRYEAVYVELADARAELDLLDRLLERVEVAPDRMAVWSTLLAHPRFLENETLGGLLERLTLLEEQRIAALALRRPGSREVLTLEEQIHQSDVALRRLVSEYRTSLSEAVAELEVRMAELDGLVGALPSQLIAFGRRQRDVRILSEVSVLTEQRLRQEELRLALAFSNVQVVDPPALRYRPLWPRKKLGLAVGLLLAGGAGLLSMVVVERADPTVRSASWVEAATGAPVLAVTISDRDPSERELDAVRSALGGGGAVVSIDPAATQATRLAAASGVWAEAVGSYADAVDVSGRTDVCVIVCLVGRSRRADLERVTTWLRRAGCPVTGLVLVAGKRREADAAWG